MVSRDDKKEMSNAEKARRFEAALSGAFKAEPKPFKSMTPKRKPAQAEGPRTGPKRR